MYQSVTIVCNNIRHVCIAMGSKLSSVIDLTRRAMLERLLISFLCNGDLAYENITNYIITNNAN
jgi:hypothetical protein